MPGTRLAAQFAELTRPRALQAPGPRPLLQRDRGWLSAPCPAPARAWVLSTSQRGVGMLDPEAVSDLQAALLPLSLTLL